MASTAHMCSILIFQTLTPRIFQGHPILLRSEDPLLTRVSYFRVHQILIHLFQIMSVDEEEIMPILGDAGSNNAASKKKEETVEAGSDERWLYCHQKLQ